MDLIQNDIYNWDLVSELLADFYGIHNYTRTTWLIGDNAFLFFLNLANTPVIIKFFDGLKGEFINSEVSFVKFLYEQNLPVYNFVIDTHGEYVVNTSYRAKNIVSFCMTCLKGGHPLTFNEQKIVKLAAFVAQAHYWGARFAKDHLSQQLPVIHSLEKEIYDLQKRVQNSNSNILQKYSDKLFSLERKLSSNQIMAERVIIHGDYRPPNVLFVRNDLTGILDFSDLRLAPIEYDLAVCADTLLAANPGKHPVFIGLLVTKYLRELSSSQIHLDSELIQLYALYYMFRNTVKAHCLYKENNNQELLSIVIRRLHLCNIIIDDNFLKCFHRRSL